MRTNTKRILALCAAAGAAGMNGAEAAEAIGVSIDTAKQVFTRGATKGVCFSGGHHKDCRYFTVQAHAAAWTAEHSGAALIAKRIADSVAAKAAAKAARLAAMPPKKPQGRNKIWSKEEEALFLELYPTNGAAFIADKTGKTLNQVYAYASHMAIKRVNRYPKRHPKQTAMTFGKAAAELVVGFGERQKHGPANMNCEPDMSRAIFTRCPSPAYVSLTDARPWLIAPTPLRRLLS